MTEHAVLKEIQSGKISPLYLFFGSEEYLIEDTLNQAIEILVDPSSKDFNFNIYHAEGSSPSEILDTARTLPFMTKHRVIIVKRVDAAKQTFMQNRELLNYLESPYKETCIIFTASDIDQRKKFFKSISKTGKAVHFKKLKTHQTTKWIIEKTKANGYRIDSSASEYLADAFNNNLKRINTELEKIFLYSEEKKSIDLDTVQLVAGNPKVDSIFDLTESIGEKSIDNSLGKMETLLSHGALPLQTLGMITRQFRLIWQAKALTKKKASPTEISSKIGVHPYFVGKIISQAGKFSRENLIYAFERLLQADVELKSSSRSPILIMESLVIDLCLS
ncbi:MAG TPA: DNA polymerase III subunit delta [Nitrospinota bacterium]|jgi:DNA polymerase-3 subunit delta|nr:DNA polymerase III subunit delta [Nitrospinota bacterium]